MQRLLRLGLGLFYWNLKLRNDDVLGIEGELIFDKVIDGRFFAFFVFSDYRWQVIDVYRLTLKQTLFSIYYYL